MAKTILLFRDSAGDPISDSIDVTLYGPLEDTPSENTSILEPVAGNSNGVRVFTDLVLGSYNVKFDTIVQAGLSPMFIAGPVGSLVPTIAPGSIDTDELADDAVDGTKLAGDAVTGDHIADDAVGSEHIADDAVTGDHIADESVTPDKVSSGFFNDKMTNDSGWGPKVDGSTIDYDESSQLEVADGGIGTNQLADNAVTGDKLADNTVVEGKIADDAVSTDKIQDLAVTGDKIAEETITGTNIAGSTITLSHLTSQCVADLRILASSIAQDVAYVSPNFTGAEAPYFTTIQDAVDYLEDAGISGTIRVFPGTYTEQVVINSSISIIGEDQLKTIIQYTPTVSKPAAISVEGVGSSNIALRNFSVYCISDNVEATVVYGIKLSTLGNYWLLCKNLNVKSVGRTHSSDPKAAHGIYSNNANLSVQDCEIQVEGGSTSGSGINPGQAFGIYFASEAGTSYKNAFTGCNIKATGGAGPILTAKGYPIFVGQYVSIGAVQANRCTLEGDEAIHTDIVGGITPTMIACTYKTEVDTNVVSKAQFIASTQDANVKILEEL